mmetsp:Transcript_29475/g.74058  ORF Transcript_29475/g.74058 Transcript_29475/m.74058 type:complete len:216 (-) Transcript_29475:243-890(-)
MDWNEGRRYTVALSFPSAEGAAEGARPFTAWTRSQELDLTGWVNPHTLMGYGKLEYPTLIDHDSPFTLAELASQVHRKKAARGAEQQKADALSYMYVGNRSLYLYFQAHRQLIMRLPVAWTHADSQMPAPPYPENLLPPNPRSATTLLVVGAGILEVNGKYLLQGKPRSYNSTSLVYTKDSQHHIVPFGGLPAEAAQSPGQWKGRPPFPIVQMQI